MLKFLVPRKWSSPDFLSCTSNSHNMQNLLNDTRKSSRCEDMTSKMPCLNMIMLRLCVLAKKESKRTRAAEEQLSSFLQDLFKERPYLNVSDASSMFTKSVSVLIFGAIPSKTDSKKTKWNKFSISFRQHICYSSSRLTYCSVLKVDERPDLIWAHRSLLSDYSPAYNSQ